MSAEGHDDLHAEPTEGFKVGEKKTIDEYQQLGASTHCRNPPFPHSSAPQSANRSLPSVLRSLMNPHHDTPS